MVVHTSHVSEAMTLRMINVPVYKHWKESVEMHFDGVSDVVKCYKDRTSSIAADFLNELNERFPGWRKIYNDAYYLAKRERTDARKRDEREIVRDMPSHDETSTDERIHHLEHLLKEERRMNEEYKREIERLKHSCTTYMHEVSRLKDNLKLCQDKLYNYETKVRAFFSLVQ